jgi:hypothetical protein
VIVDVRAEFGAFETIGNVGGAYEYVAAVCTVVIVFIVAGNAEEAAEVLVALLLRNVDPATEREAIAKRVGVLVFFLGVDLAIEIVADGKMAVFVRCPTELQIRVERYEAAGLNQRHNRGRAGLGNVRVRVLWCPEHVVVGAVAGIERESHEVGETGFGVLIVYRRPGASDRRQRGGSLS